MLPCSHLGHIAPQAISQIVSRIFPGRRIHTIRSLEGGKTNCNLLVAIAGYQDLFVLRQHRRGQEACQREITVLQALQQVLPVPEIIDADPAGERGGTAYLFYRYVPGHTFRQLRDHGSSQDMADAARAIGRCLPLLGQVTAPQIHHHSPPQRFEVSKNDLDSPLLRQHLGTEDCQRLQELQSAWSAVLQTLPCSDALRHGDCNHRNIVLHQRKGTWEVASILDWELAGTGSFLWDAARFVCYRKPDSNSWEDAFYAGLKSNSAELPDNFRSLFLTLNILAAAKSLANGSLQEQFVEELKLLVRRGLRGRRPG